MSNTHARFVVVCGTDDESSYWLFLKLRNACNYANFLIRCNKHGTIRLRCKKHRKTANYGTCCETLEEF